MASWPWLIGLFLFLLVLVFGVYAFVASLAEAGAAMNTCIAACKEGLTGCKEIKGVMCCVGIKGNGINLDENCKVIS